MWRQGRIFYGDYKATARLYEIALRATESKGRKPNFQIVQHGAMAYTALGDLAKASGACRRALEKSLGLAPADVYQLALFADVADEAAKTFGDVKKLQGVIAAADRRHAGGLAGKERVARAERVGAAFLCAGREDVVRAFSVWKMAAVPPFQKKRATVRYSAAPVSGPESWEKAGPAPEKMTMDRVYGGNVEVLMNDVGTGRGAVGAAHGGEPSGKPVITILADVKGLHFRFVVGRLRARYLAGELSDPGRSSFPAAPERATGSAQFSKRTVHQRAQSAKALDAEIAAAKSTPLAEHLRRVKAGAARNPAAAELASRVAADFTNAPAEPFLIYAVPAMSDFQRLPDLYPSDAEAGAPVRIVAAKGEFEPGAFLVYPLRDLGKVSFNLSPLRTADGKTFPAANLDMKVVKVWYQNRNGWYSYFGDTGFKLCPELLLHDEDLIRVDTDKEANYARVTGADGKVVEHWLNPPRDMDRRHFDWYRKPHVFQSMAPGFSDAKSLKPVALTEGAFRNIFLTAHVTEDVPEVLYKGAVNLADASGRRIGSIPVELRVLPFTLPSPKCRFDPGRDFLNFLLSYDTIYCVMVENGGDEDLARKQLLAILKNQAEHNQDMHLLHAEPHAEVELTFDLMREAGQRLDTLVVMHNRPPRTPAAMEADGRRLKAWFDRKFGHHNVYLMIGDEPGANLFRAAADIYRSYTKNADLKTLLGGGDTIFRLTPHLIDWHPPV